MNRFFNFSNFWSNFGFECYKASHCIIEILFYSSQNLVFHHTFSVYLQTFFNPKVGWLLTMFILSTKIVCSSKS